MLKRFIAIFAVVTLFLGLFFYQVRQNEIRVVKERLALTEIAHVKLQVRLLASFFIGYLADVEIVSELHKLKEIAMGATDHSSLEYDLLSFSGIRGHYDQIRYLDKNGLEKIRVDSKNGKPFLVAREFLQDKSDSYYFDEIRQLKPGQIYLSPLDLNVEHLEIERPFKPMLRIGAPIFDQNATFQGALIINCLADPMLESFRGSSFESHGETSLLNYAGFWLSAETPDDEWGFMVTERRTKNFARRYPAVWKKIISEWSGQIEGAAGLFTFSTFNPLALSWRVSTSCGYHLTSGTDVDESHIPYPWKIVSLVTNAHLQEIIKQKLKNKETLWLGLFGLLFFLSGSLLWIFFKSRQKEREQQERIVRINASLETQIEERTDQLNKSNKKLSTILETTLQGFIMIDMEARVIKVNSAMLGMLGRSYEEVVGASWFNLAGDENREFMLEKLAMHKTGLNDEYNLNIPKPDGGTFFCHVAATTLINEENEVEGGFALVSDIGERLEFEQNLEKAKMEAEKNSAAKTLFLSSMSHEFRTPMNSILGFAQLLAEEETLSRKQKDFVEKILVSGDHLKALINDILDLAKIEAGAVEINITTVDICQAMHDIVGMVNPEAKALSVELITREPKTHCMVKADPVRLQQIILNLINNAIKYNHVGGRVEVFCEKIDQEWIRLNVVDDGPGIAPHMRAFLFEPFNRLGAETSTTQGSGLGLAISRNLAQLMACHLGLLEKKSSGCHFYIDLPLADQESVTGAKTLVQSAKIVPSSSDTSIKSCTLLYIEDNELNRMLLASIIEKRPSFTLFSAVDGRQGIEMALKELPDLVLADIGLPDIDGFAVLAELQKHTTTRKIPVVALSGNASDGDIEKAYAAGFVGYLTKPINIGRLFGTIDEILSNAGVARK